VTHPAVRTVLAGLPLREALPTLVDAWRADRTTELADAITIIDEITHGAAPVLLESPAAVDEWCATWPAHLGAALAELAGRARACWDLVLSPLDAGHVVNASQWAGFARCAGALRAAAPDPRIGRAIESALRGPCDHMFRVDQVHHVVDRFEAPNDDLSFADHAFALLDIHADGGTAARLDGEARRALIEADCNGAELAHRLLALAHELRARYATDHTLLEADAKALRMYAADARS
jgi:hypothetical protein